ncbi:MAG: hypothetical protein OEM77_02090 [Nitrosopumilus sp.]|nr:hypothetical protein [Nitrosopumilus sp.]MDH3823598.1 hypothetical protein [Nitrosopumilus sp.]
MDSKIAMFSILALAAIFAMMLPMDSAIAQTSNVSPNGEGEYKDGERKEGKSCPFKDKKNASVNTDLNI